MIILQWRVYPLLTVNQYLQPFGFTSICIYTFSEYSVLTCRSFSHGRQPHKTSSDIKHILTALFETNIKWLAFNYFSINGDWSAKFITCTVWKADNVFSIPQLYEQRHTVLLKHSNASVYLWSISVTHHVMMLEWFQGKAFEEKWQCSKYPDPWLTGLDYTILRRL